jgi:hypothetical protein
MSAAEDQGKRIQANCKIIWGDDDYNIDIETDDWTSYLGYVKKDFGFSFGPLLAMTGFCSSREETWDELDRMLGVWAGQVRSGKPMIKD